MGCIYLITVKNGKRYVGMTIQPNPKTRLYCHKKSDCPIGNALRKHKTFSLEILFESTNREELCKKEIYYIKKLRTKKPHGYNLTSGGDGSIGFPMSQKNRTGMRKRMRGNKNLAGIKWTPEQRRKILETRKRRDHSKALSRGLTRKWKDPVWRKKMLGVLAANRKRRWGVRN